MTKELILASQSPRRYELLKDAGYEFITRKYDVKEVYPDSITEPTKIAVYLAELKFKAAQQEMSENQIALTSDTIVVLDGEIIGKPEDRADAIRTLTRLSNRSHQVVTAVSLAQTSSVLSDYDTSIVHFFPLSQKRDRILYRHLSSYG